MILHGAQIVNRSNIKMFFFSWVQHFESIKLFPVLQKGQSVHIFDAMIWWFRNVAAETEM